MSEKEKNICKEIDYNQIFNDYATPLYRFVYSKSSNVSLSEDIVQDAFLKLWQKCKDVPFAKAKSFLYTVASNLFIDKVRHEKVKQNFQLVAKKPSQSIETPDFQLEKKEYKAKLERIIASMPEKSREVFLMNRIESLPYREIAERLQLSQKAVEKRMGIALKYLRENLGQKI